MLRLFLREKESEEQSEHDGTGAPSSSRQCVDFSATD